MGEDHLDIVDAADSILAFQNVFRVSKGKWGAFIAPMYMNLGVDEDVGIGPLNIDADVTFEMTIIEFGGSYRVAEWSMAPGNKSTGAAAGDGWLEAIVGARYTRLETEIDLKVSAPSLGLTGSRVVEGDKDWIDPIVGARAHVNLSDRVWVQLVGDIGGFGVGSDFAWHATAFVAYDFDMFGRDASVGAGYRALYMDYEDGSGANRFAYDMTMHGPVIGLNIHF